MALKDEYFTISEAAEWLSVTRQTISRYIKQGQLPVEKIGRERVIKKQDLHNMLVDVYAPERRAKLLSKLIDAKLIEYLRKKYDYKPDEEIKVVYDKIVITRSNGEQEMIDYPELEIIIQEFDEDKKRAVVVVKPLSKTEGGKKSK